jgi:hypothetical protein
MIAKICAPNLVRAFLQTPEQRRFLRDLPTIPYNSLKAVVDVLVLVTERLIALEQENIGVAAVRDGRLGMGVELLRCAREPSLGPLPRAVIAIEARCAEGAVISRKEEIGSSHARGDPGLRAGSLRPVVAVRDEALGEVAAPRQNLTDLTSNIAAKKRLLVFSEASRSRAEPQCAGRGLPRQKVGDSADSV